MQTSQAVQRCTTSYAVQRCTKQSCAAVAQHLESRAAVAPSKAVWRWHNISKSDWTVLATLAKCTCLNQSCVAVRHNISKVVRNGTVQRSPGLASGKVQRSPGNPGKGGRLALWQSARSPSKMQFAIQPWQSARSQWHCGKVQGRPGKMQRSLTVRSECKSSHACEPSAPPCEPSAHPCEPSAPPWPSWRRPAPSANAPRSLR